MINKVICLSVCHSSFLNLPVGKDAKHSKFTGGINKHKNQKFPIKWDFASYPQRLIRGHFLEDFQWGENWSNLLEQVYASIGMCSPGTL